MEHTTVGTEIKVLLSVAVSETALTGADLDFTARFYTFTNRFVDIPKSAMVATDDGDYLAIVDTAALGEGEIFVELVAQVPDSDIIGGYRQERAQLRTGIVLRRTVYELP